MPGKSAKGQLHNGVLEAKLAQLKKELKNCKVVRLDKSYIPDAFYVDWTNKKLVAIEAETVRGAYHKYVTGDKNGNKTKRDVFDETFVLLPYTRINYTAEQYYKTLAMRKQGFSYNEIIEKLGVSSTSISHWINDQRVPYAVKRERVTNQKNLKFEVYKL